MLFLQYSGSFHVAKTIKNPLTAITEGFPKNNGNPSFEWIGKPSSDEALKLKISFPDGGEDDVAVLQRFNPIPVGPAERAEDIDNCIFHGYLLNEDGIYVTVTGCPNSRSLEVFLIISFTSQSK